MDDLAIAMDSLSIRNSTSSLERLPSDVVWKIFEYVPESFCDLRLVSSNLKYISLYFKKIQSTGNRRSILFIFSKKVWMEKRNQIVLFQTCRLLRSQMDEYVSLGTVIPLVKEIAYFGAHQRSSSVISTTFHTWKWPKQFQGEPAGKVEIIIVPLPDRGKLFELRYYKLGIPERMKRRRGTDVSFTINLNPI